MYIAKKIAFWNVLGLYRVSAILHQAGKDMAKKYDLHHWDNSQFKNAIILLLCLLKNKIYLVYDQNNQAVATFQVKKQNDSFRFQKLATLPSFAGKGVGSYCLHTIEEMAKDVGCEWVALEVYDKSRHAIAFYRNRGYTVCGETSTLKYTELKMRKKLAPKKLLVIGAGFLQSFVIKKAKEMGYFVLAVDANPNAEGFAYTDTHAAVNIVDEKACLAYAREQGIDGVLTAATDYGVLTAAYIARELGLPGLDYEAAKRIKNKYLIRKCLYENRVDDTEQAYLVDDTTDVEALATTLTYPVMVKPCDGSGSRGANRVDGPEGLAEACKIARDASITRRAEIETFIFGREYGAESLVVNGEVQVLAIMQKWMTEPPYYAELGHAIPTDLAPEVEARARECAERAIKALGLNFGSVNMDMLITPEGKIYIIDIGARMGGNMIGPCIIPYGTGVDYMANMIRNAVGDAVDLTPSEKVAVATRLLAFGGGTVKRLPDFDELEKKYGVEIYHHLEIGQNVNEYHTNLDGCGYIIARAEHIEKAIANAERALQEINEFIF